MRLIPLMPFFRCDSTSKAHERAPQESLFLAVILKWGDLSRVNKVPYAEVVGLSIHHTWPTK